MSIYDKSSLVLIPSGTKTGKVFSQKPVSGDGDFTFTRASAATRVNADGNIEKETQNFLRQSNNFNNSAWLNYNTTRTSGQAGYDGSSDAWLFEKFAANGRIVQTLSQSGVQAFSLYAKAGSLNWLKLQVYDGTSLYYAHFDLANGVLGSGVGLIDRSITSVGSGWYRCSISVNCSNQLVYIYPADGNNDTSGTTGNIYIQDAQLEQGLVARDYIDTTSPVYGGITDNTPRLDYTDSSCPALLLEPLRTNIVPISEGVPEDSTAVTLTRNYGTSPEGVQNSLKVQKLGVNSNDRIYPIDNYNATLVSGNEYSLSAFVKNIDVDGITTIACRISGNTLFRLGYEWNGSSLTKASTYANGTRTNELLEDYGNGWWRIGFTFEADGTQGNIEIDVDRDNGSDTTSIETWGWQLESATSGASYATSYIPTYGSSVSRVAETCGDAGTSSTFNSTEGVLYVETSALSSGSFRAISLSNNTNSNVVGLLYRLAANEIWMQVRGNGVETNIVVYSVNQLQNNKIAIKYKENDFALWVNGVEEGTNNSGSTPVALNTVKFARGDGGETFYGNVKQVLTFNTALSDAELAALTTI